MKHSREIILICHNLRSCHNVGSLLRTADGLGVSKVYLTGYTPYPRTDGDTRMPHIALKVHKQIQKTALGAEVSVTWEHVQDVQQLIKTLQNQMIMVVALEQSLTSKQLPQWSPATSVAIIVGREVEGIEAEVVNACEYCVEIPMLGKKESFNVVQAAAMALYHCRFR
jgi:23S rRNA (guanosine2251-2'-O)-methyltransferase